MRYKITLSYDGSAFCGWQVQPNAPSVQQVLENALSTLLRDKISVTGAGRTDTGVNAVGYVAHFDFTTDNQSPLDCRQIGYKLNAILPAQISIQEIIPVDEEFHSRFSATRREYTYFLHRTKDPFADRFSYLCTYPLDIQAMNVAAEALLGTHDFSCFEKTGGDNKTSICTVTEAFWRSYKPTHADLMGYRGAVTRNGKPEDEPDYLYFRISADRFLRNMVRAIVGTLIEVGRGKRSPEEFAALILPPDTTISSPGRCAAGESAPGHALFLSEVTY